LSSIRCRIADKSNVRFAHIEYLDRKKLVSLNSSDTVDDICDKILGAFKLDRNKFYVNIKLDDDGFKDYAEFDSLDFLPNRHTKYVGFQITEKQYETISACNHNTRANDYRDNDDCEGLEDLLLSLESMLRDVQI
ncbi:unnamed protein product, partial [Didymodactylos carnosus]